MVITRPCSRCDGGSTLATWHTDAKTNQLYHWCTEKQQYRYENGKKVDRPSPKSSKWKKLHCDHCEARGVEPEWESGPKKDIFHYCKSSGGYRYADGGVRLTSDQEVERPQSHPYSAQSRPCANCSAPVWNYDAGRGMHFHACGNSYELAWEDGTRENRRPIGQVPPQQRPEFAHHRPNASGRLDNCGWVTLAALLKGTSSHQLMTTSDIYAELQKANIQSANSDQPASAQDVMNVADQFGNIEQRIFTNPYSMGIPANQLPMSNVPPKKNFSASLYIPNANLGHVVLGYWQPSKDFLGRPTYWFRFTDFQNDPAGEDFTNQALSQGYLVKDVYWFVEDRH